ncbi:GspH/FimT family pseudopilin [uncultured Thiodictyon sp.]|uniref:GspH/FimT family pseudopilin n=1 Tax=uncultured Thiodictyon sp. TaxID=1846217 RepID=UPI0025FF4E81|nr:GspH/FimT family pseudopilin [uncultured Thiodictyon sp.]
MMGQIDRRSGGFTLVELLLTVTVMTILVLLAAPSFNEATLGSKLSAYANRLVASAYLARGEAIKRNALITLCVSTDGSTCATAGGWEQGWIVRCPSTTSTSVTCTTGGSSAIIFQYQPALPAGFKIGTATANQRSLVFYPTGVDPRTQAVLTVCRNAPLGKQERQVRIGATGGASVKTTTTGTCT